MEALVSWARANGGVWHDALTLRDGPRGRGVFASAPITRYQLLLRLPTSLAIHPSPEMSVAVQKYVHWLIN